MLNWKLETWEGSNLWRTDLAADSCTCGDDFWVSNFLIKTSIASDDDDDDDEEYWGSSKSSIKKMKNNNLKMHMILVLIFESCLLNFG